MRVPYDGELEEVRNRAELSERDYSEEERVSFRDAELERMICEALGKPDVEAVYASELETVTRLSMRFGIAAFNEEVINASVGNRQDKPPDLSDLALLPNLRDGDLEKQISTNEVLSACRDAIAVVEPPAGVEGIPFPLFPDSPMKKLLSRLQAWRASAPRPYGSTCLIRMPWRRCCILRC